MSSNHTAVRLIREPEFLKIWSTGALSMTMRWMEIVVIGIYTQQTTHSALAVAAMLFARMCPTLLFGAFSGALAERLDRRGLLMTGLALSCVVSLTLAILAATQTIELWHIAAGAFVGGTFWSIEFPTRRTLLGEIAGMERIAPAMGLDSATNHVTRMIGPAVGGLLLEIAGLAAPFCVGVVLYSAALLNVATLKFRSELETVSADGVMQIITEGLVYLRTNNLVAGTLFVTMLVNFFGFSYGAMVPVIGETTFEVSAFPIGVLVSMEGIGATLGALAIAWFARAAYFSRIYLSGAVLFLFMIVLFSLTPWYTLSLPILFVGGFGIAGFGSMQSAIVFAATAPQMRRRVMGVLVVCIGAGPLGVLHTGLMADWLGAEVAIRLIAVEGLAALAMCVWKFPELYRLNPNR